MFVSAEFIEKLRNNIDISHVISKRVKLTKKGREYSGLCPFHNERTASFTVNDEKKFYHCFGCGAHGDIIKFTMDIFGLEFTEAVRSIANEAMIAIPSENKIIENYKSNLNNIYNILEISAEWFQSQLYSSLPTAKKYLKDRNISEKIIKEFNIGFAPSGNMLRNYLLSKNISEEDMFRAGILVRTDEGKYYDRFRSRIIFPIADKSGRVIAFGGRSIGGEQPKYLNSSETLLFKKNEILYNMHNAKNTAFKSNRLIVVEGYIDVVSMSKGGFTETVATLGTAINETNINNLWKINSEPIICLDGDDAGQKAMKRISNIVIPMLRAGYSLRFAILPLDKDPDNIINKYGSDHMQKILDSSLPLSEILWRNELVGIDNTATPEKKAYIEQNLMSICKNIKDNKVKANYREYFLTKIRQNLRKDNTIYKKKEQLTYNLAINIINPITMCENRLFYIIINYPILLSDYLIEEEFTMLEITNSTLEELRLAILQTKNFFSSEELFNIKKEDFKKKLCDTLEILEYNYDLNYLDSEYNIFTSEINDMNKIKMLWECNINKYRINLLMEEKQTALNLMTDESIEKAKIIHNQILLLEDNIAITSEIML